MQQLNLPEFPFKISEKDGETKIYDVFRKKYIVLTPEEWVRQNFLWWLNQHKGYPAGLISLEAPAKYNMLPKRADAVIYGRDGKPLMVVECKAPDVKITQDTFDQVGRYNVFINADYIAVSNGIEHFCCKTHPVTGWQFLNHVPDYKDLSSH